MPNTTLTGLQHISGHQKLRFENAVDFSIHQIKQLVNQKPDLFPMYTINGRWKIEGETWTNWCEGFIGGQLWLAYLITKDNFFRDKAKHYCRLIEPRKTDSKVHDLGFLFWPTWKCWYDLEGDPLAWQVVLEAGTTLANRFQPRGGYLCSFLAENSLFIDIMMNIGIVFYTAQQKGDKDLWNIACSHVQTTRRTLVRGDGSTAHEGVFDPQSGEFLHQSTQQGWRSDSCWARGLAWAIYGFGTAFTYSHDPHDLSTAEACAQYFIEHTPTHGIPPNDWEEPSPKYSYESSAAAIAAGGLWQLSHLTGDPAHAWLYRSTTLQILDTLSGPEFLAADNPEWEGILKHGIYHQPKGLGVDESVAWGDYFFLETLLKVIGVE